MSSPTPLTHVLQMGQEELGKHYYNTGEYANAGKAYAKMRDYCTTQKHVADMTLRLVFVSIAQRSWNSVANYCTKLHTVSVKTDERERLLDIANACQGLSGLAQGSYQYAAEQFMAVSPSYVTMEPVAGIQFQKAVVTGNDVAVYGGLCALASMDRHQLQERVLNNTNFRQFLELEPHIRRAISAFVQSKYTTCLSILDSYRTDYMLDLYLQRHFEDIYSRVRSKSIVEYFIPFSTVTLAELEKAFPQRNPANQGIEAELISMIQRGLLDARIDLVDKLLVAPKAVPRTQVQQEAMGMAKNYERALRLRLLRVNMAAAGLEIEDKKKGKGGGAQGMQMDLASMVGGDDGFGRGGGKRDTRTGTAGSLRSGGRRLGG